MKKILRRIHARWRLHRMEWNRLQRCLEPPKGYEKYHSEEEVFPGMRYKLRFKSWDHFRESLKGGWKIYMHHYRPDPEVARWLEEMEMQETAKYEERGKKAAEVFTTAVEKGKANIEQVGAELHAAKPDVQDYLKDRATVLQKAVSEFAAGFHETVDGSKNVWGATPPDDDFDDDGLMRNYPVVYRVRDGGHE